MLRRISTFGMLTAMLLLAGGCGFTPVSAPSVPKGLAPAPGRIVLPSAPTISHVAGRGWKAAALKAVSAAGTRYLVVGLDHPTSAWQAEAVVRIYGYTGSGKFPWVRVWQSHEMQVIPDPPAPVFSEITAHGSDRALVAMTVTTDGSVSWTFETGLVLTIDASGKIIQRAYLPSLKDSVLTSLAPDEIAITTATCYPGLYRARYIGGVFRASPLCKLPSISETYRAYYKIGGDGSAYAAGPSHIVLSRRDKFIKFVGLTSQYTEIYANRGSGPVLPINASLINTAPFYKVTKPGRYEFLLCTSSGQSCSVTASLKPTFVITVGSRH